METIHLHFFMMLCLGVHRSSSEMMQRHKRNWIIDSFTINEGEKRTKPYSLGTIKIEKEFTIFRIHGQGVDEEPKGIFKINDTTGEITVHGSVDYEEYHTLMVIFQALDGQKNVVDTELGIEIVIIDSNDNPPVFEIENYEISIKESTLQGIEVIAIKANDEDSENNGIFDLQIVSVTPKPQDLEFVLNQTNIIGSISFKGCLEHEKAEKYTIIVEAKDRGEPENLSSSCTVIINVEDENNHLPVITKHTGPGKVKEGQKNVLVSRLQVTDQDSKGTGAWRAKYQIQGDINNDFRITTDPETNEGLLYVEKPLDYEEGPLKNLTIIVENEIPYYSCKVEHRSTTGLWKVATSGVTTKGSASIDAAFWTEQIVGLSSYHVTVIVEDVDEAPIFVKPNKTVKVSEHVAVGQYLETFAAIDPDVRSARLFVYKKGEDPANWVTVDSVTGKITTSKMLDRESSFVKDDIYKITVYAFNNGELSMTGTATLTIFIEDENDNAPSLIANTIDMCQMDGQSQANITAVDLDGDPFAGPFHFKLSEDVQGKWKVDRDHGYSFNLVKDNTINSGHYELLLAVSDLQGKTAVHNLSVTVCKCLDTARPNCRLRIATSTILGGTFAVIFLTILLFIGTLLLAFLMSCKKQSIPFPDLDARQHVMEYFTESPGSDCKVTLVSNKENNHNKTSVTKMQQVSVKSSAPERAIHSTGLLVGQEQRIHSYRDQIRSGMTVKDGMWMTDSASRALQPPSKSCLSRSKSLTEQSFIRRSHMRASLGVSRSSSTMISRQLRNSTCRTQVGHSNYSKYQGNNFIQRIILPGVIKRKLYTLQASAEEVGDYAPQVYTLEGDPETNYELDAISISDIPFDPDLDLDLKFTTLAAICMDNDSTIYNEKNNSHAMGKHQIMTLI